MRVERIGKCVLYLGDCMAIMPRLAPGLADAIITDPPYGLTDAAWDTPPPLDAWWLELRRLGRAPFLTACFCQQPFTTDLIASNRKNWRYELIIEKANSVGFLEAKWKPLRAHEHVQVFSSRLRDATYNAQLTAGPPFQASAGPPCELWHSHRRIVSRNRGVRQPRSVLKVANCVSRGGHPCAKPIVLMEWLVRTYSNPGETVFDPYMGLATTGVACVRNGRRFVGIEKDRRYFAMACRRIRAAYAELRTADRGQRTKSCNA